MRQVFPNVAPIRPGYVSPLSIAFAQSFWDEMQLSTGRLVAQFRKSLDEPVIFTADSDAGSIARPGGRVVIITVPADKSADFTGNIAVFDLVRLDGGVQTPIPGRWQWPVFATVTRDVA